MDKNMINKKRENGILMPIASLPGKYGIGTLGKEAYKFVDTLDASGVGYWQILPLGPTGYGDSPYQSFSTFAGNPYFIDLEKLIEMGLLKKSECDACDFGDNDNYINYEKIYRSRFDLLRKAYERSDIEYNRDFVAFEHDNAFWLEDYALYTAIKDSLGGVAFIEWDERIRRREESALSEYREKCADEIMFCKFMQYMFNLQWTQLKSYANERGIRFIGDIPIYVAFDSADTWANPELFQFDSNGYPTAVAGCPPDAFAPSGQLWGNPLYDWDYHAKTGYAWWIKRIKNCFKLYDMVRIDHFRGFDEYYSVPYGHDTAEFGTWKKGPGIELFNVIREKLGDLPMIAEDLGFLTESVRELVEVSGYPGMKVLQFAFDSREDSDYLPHNYGPNSVVYTGTHDNDTTIGWFASINPDDKKMALEYMNVVKPKETELNWALIKLAMSSVSNLCVIPMQDYLGLGGEARINRPSTLGGNWEWRMEKGAFDTRLRKRILSVVKLYARARQ